MNKNRSLLAAYFRQLSELAVPDPILSKPFAFQPLAAPGSLKSDPPVTAKGMFVPQRGSRVALSAVREIPRASAVVQPGRKLYTVDRLHSSAVPPKQAAQGVVETTAPASNDEKRAMLHQYYYSIKDCHACPLGDSRKKFVFGAGNAAAQLMVIGEAPGADEDDQGVPFVGKAGQLLTDMLSAIKLDRKKDVFIANVLKCRPPENRNPGDTEILACRPILLRQIEIIQPRILLLLGRIAAHALLDTAESIARLRGSVHHFGHIPALVTYHPAALLRNPQYKRPAWEDLKQVLAMMKEMGIHVSE
jgi:uracil-DNA glycosylase